MNESDRRVVVTGAAGRLGRTVAETFLAAGFSVVATDIVDPGDLSFPICRADLRDHRQVLDLLSGADVVLHIGNHPGLGGTPPQVVFNDNTSINENVFQGAVESGVRTVVFASTIQLVGSKPDERTVVSAPPMPAFPISDETPPQPANVYALSKQVSEVMLRYYAERCGVTGVAVRLPLLHHHEPHFAVRNGTESIHDIFEGFIGLTYTDAARLFVAIVQSDLSGYNVFMAGTSHRHIDRSVSDLVESYYPSAPAGTSDLVDLTPVTAATGWCPSPPEWPVPSAVISSEGGHQ